MNEIPTSTWDLLPAAVREALNKATPIHQGQFMEEYNRKKKTLGIAYLLWFCLGLHYAYIGKWGLTLLMWLTLVFGVGIIWWLIDAFRLPKLVRNKNKDTATEVYQSLKNMWN